MLILPQNLSDTVKELRSRIAAAAVAAGRSVDSVTLVAVGKGQPASSLEAAAACGLRDFGENYVQEAIPKMEALAIQGLSWHFIGPLQTNKTRPVAQRFDWVHSVDRERIAERLAAQRPFHAPALNVCVQVNVARESGKSGARPEELPALVRSIRSMPRLALRGLMCLPPLETEPARQRRWFAATRALFEELNAQGAGLDVLSMGMSGDFEAAIAEGATHVRIGTALFGPRA